jgi:chitinase
MTIPSLRVLACVLALQCATSFAETNAAPRAEDFRVVAYVAGWSMPAGLHPEHLTHINFAFAKIEDGGVPGFEDPEAPQKLRTLRALKRKNPALKVLVSVGGWEAEGFSDAALTDASRATFARSTLALLRQYSLDGVDLDWEYPGQGVAGIKYRAQDKENFTLLVKTLREAFDTASRADKRHYLLTIAGADHEYFDHVEMKDVARYVDWINVMSYDFFNSLTKTTGHHAGLYPSTSAAPTDRNADTAITQYLAASVSPKKLVLGVAFYGREFAGVRAVNNGLNQPYEHYAGDHSYAELVANFIGKQAFVRYWDDIAKAPYLWNSASRTFISYDDPRSIGIKTIYAKGHHLGGMMFWELSQDKDGALLNAIVGK